MVVGSGVKRSEMKPNLRIKGDGSEWLANCRIKSKTAFFVHY